MSSDTYSHAADRVLIDRPWRRYCLPRTCRADPCPLEVKLMAGHGAAGSRPGRHDAVDVLGLYTGSGSGPGHELTDGRGHRP